MVNYIYMFCMKHEAKSERDISDSWWCELEVDQYTICQLSVLIQDVLQHNGGISGFSAKTILG